MSNNYDTDPKAVLLNVSQSWIVLNQSSVELTFSTYNNNSSHNSSHNSNTFSNNNSLSGISSGDVLLTHIFTNNNNSITDANSSVLTDGNQLISNQMLYIVLTSLILGFLTLSTVIGNVFVIAAILLERNLRTVGNYLVLSLAVADLMVACLVMPLGAVSEVVQEWALGRVLCELWTLADVLCCTASILHLLAIAIVSLLLLIKFNYFFASFPLIIITEKVCNSFFQQIFSQNYSQKISETRITLGIK